MSLFNNNQLNLLPPELYNNPVKLFLPLIAFVFIGCSSGPKQYVFKHPEVVDFDGLAPLFGMQNDTTYIINFWATWCAPCIKELPYFEQITKDFEDKPVKVILVSLDFADKIEERVVPFMKQEELRSTVIILDDPAMNDWIPKVDESWSGAIPATYMYKNANRIFVEGDVDHNYLVSNIQKLSNPSK